ncbi:hypothetical protein BGAL_0050g00070 [Botrytis galanthina]|uniref:Uncharacterized protein n=1 Tax=Botrytis galanthina TaxID=278940 RepID=A0A4S8R749_9HELO|nr:hypothetical protein BGAL_0050g00070 [Botrytis galanthina]
MTSKKDSMNYHQEVNPPEIISNIKEYLRRRNFPPPALFSTARKESRFGRALNLLKWDLKLYVFKTGLREKSLTARFVNKLKA